MRILNWGDELRQGLDVEQRIARDGVQLVKHASESSRDGLRPQVVQLEAGQTREMEHLVFG